MSATATTLTDQPTVPVCEECDEPLRPVGGGRHPYWTCAYCGTIRERSA